MTVNDVRAPQPSSDDCPECEGRLRRRRTETRCDRCGLVQGVDEIDRGPEWRSLDDKSDRRRTGAPLTFTRHDRGLSTRIGFETETDTNSDRRRQLVRMRRQHNRARLDSTSKRNRRYACTEIQRMVAAISLSDSVCEQACSLFASAQSENLLSGRTIEGFAAATVYATCRTQSIARTIEEVVAVARADRDEFTAAYDALNRDLGLPVGPIDPTEYIPRYATKANLPTAVERRAGEFAVVLAETGRMGGKNPSGVAAACLYKAAHERGHEITQRRLAAIAHVSRVTLGASVRDIETIAGPPDRQQSSERVGAD